jgi:hypothetical protein
MDDGVQQVRVDGCVHGGGALECEAMGVDVNYELLGCAWCGIGELDCVGCRFVRANGDVDGAALGGICCGPQVEAQCDDADDEQSADR